VLKWSCAIGRVERINELFQPRQRLSNANVKLCFGVDGVDWQLLPKIGSLPVPSWLKQHGGHLAVVA